MTSIRKRALIILIILISCAFMCGVFWMEIKEGMWHIKPTLDIEIDDIVGSYGYFDLWFPKDENKQLNADVVSICFGDENIFVFLPGGTDVKRLVYYFRDGEGNLLKRQVGNFSNPFDLGKYKVSVRYSNLPVMFIRLKDRSEYDKALETNDKQIYCYGDMRIVVDPQKAEENQWYSGYASYEGDNGLPGTMSIHGRGNLSWYNCSKRSFTLSLEKSQNLLGMGYRKKWNLIGQAYDKTLIRNTGFNTMAERLGIKYQPEMQEINLYVDDEYKGVYLLTSKVEVGKNDVNLGKNDILYNLNAPESVQYVTYTSDNWFPDGNEMPIAEIVYPKNPTDSDLEKAQTILQKVMNAIDDADSDDYLEYIDLDSWVNYYWIQEASMNFDAWGRSMYCYYNFSDGKLYMGPVWDMDITLGSPYEKEGMMFTTPEGFRVRKAGIYKGLFAHDSFRKAVDDAYYNNGVREAFKDNLSVFEDNKSEIGYDGHLNYVYYGYVASGVALDYGANSYDEECDTFLDFYSRRIEWIDSEMEKCTTHDMIK